VTPPAAWVVLLRGINVGGHNRVPMATLRAHFTRAGCDDVRTYIQSGNLVFRAPRAVATRAIATLRDTLTTVGVNVPVVSRTGAELAAAVNANPYARDGVDPTHLHVGFLADRPTASRAQALDPDRSPPDRWHLVGRELFLACPRGIAKTRLTSGYLDTTLGTSVTIRNWRTTLAILDLVGR